MVIKHFGGIESTTNIDELLEILTKRYGDGVNEFWMTEESKDNPCLVILVNNGLANVTYFPNADSIGFQSVGNLNSLNPDEYSVFYTNTTEEEIEISNSAIVPFEDALKAAFEFFKKFEMPNCIEWFKN